MVATAQAADRDSKGDSQLTITRGGLITGRGPLQWGFVEPSLGLSPSDLSLAT